MKDAEESFIRTLAESHPDLGTLLTGHLSVYHGELLPHLFLGEATEWLEHAMAAGREPEVRTFLDLVESQFESNEGVREMIAVSFLENLPRPPEPAGKIREFLGSALREELRNLESGTGG